MWKDISKKLYQIVDTNSYDVAFAIGWKYILPVDLFSKLRYGLIIYHDSLLPRYRGFSPIPTALINGEKEVGATVLLAADDMDSGDIIIQKKATIESTMYVNKVIDIIGDLYCEMTICLLEILENAKDIRDIKTIKQDINKVTYSAWRNIEDCQIDWKSDSRNIYNLIRAVSKPYPGAFSFIKNDKIIIWKADIIDDINFEKRYPGKVWKLDNGYPLVICGKGMIKILYAECKGKNIIPFKKLRVNFISKLI